MAHEIHNSKDEYVGYFNARTNTVVDVRRQSNGKTVSGGLDANVKMASAKLARRNAAERLRIRQFRAMAR